MRTIVIVMIMVALTIAGCRFEKDFQVYQADWTLLKKEPAFRNLIDGEYSSFVWLVWRSDRGVIYREKIRTEDSIKFVNGLHMANREKR